VVTKEKGYILIKDFVAVIQTIFRSTGVLYHSLKTLELMCTISVIDAEQRPEYREDRVVTKENGYILIKESVVVIRTIFRSTGVLYHSLKTLDLMCTISIINAEQRPECREDRVVTKEKGYILIKDFVVVIRTIFRSLYHSLKTLEPMYTISVIDAEQRPEYREDRVVTKEKGYILIKDFVAVIQTIFRSTGVLYHSLKTLELMCTISVIDAEQRPEYREDRVVTKENGYILIKEFVVVIRTIFRSTGVLYHSLKTLDLMYTISIINAEQRPECREDRVVTKEKGYILIKDFVVVIQTIFGSQFLEYFAGKTVHPFSFLNPEICLGPFPFAVLRNLDFLAVFHCFTLPLLCRTRSSPQRLCIIWLWVVIRSLCFPNFLYYLMESVFLHFVPLSPRLVGMTLGPVEFRVFAALHIYHMVNFMTAERTMHCPQGLPVARKVAPFLCLPR
jgi:hypothetical protein